MRVVSVDTSTGQEGYTVATTWAGNERGETHIVRPCVGCGFCCMRSPCGVWTEPVKRAMEEGWKDGCPELTYKDGRHWCGAILRMETESAKSLLKARLSVGAGCCAGLNSWRREKPILDRTSGRNSSSYSCER